MCAVDNFQRLRFGSLPTSSQESVKHKSTFMFTFTLCTIYEVNGTATRFLGLVFFNRVSSHLPPPPPLHRPHISLSLFVWGSFNYFSSNFLFLYRILYLHPLPPHITQLPLYFSFYCLRISCDIYFGTLHTPPPTRHNVPPLSSIITPNHHPSHHGIYIYPPRRGGGQQPFYFFIDIHRYSGTSQPLLSHR